MKTTLISLSHNWATESSGSSRFGTRREGRRSTPVIGIRAQPVCVAEIEELSARQICLLDETGFEREWEVGDINVEQPESMFQSNPPEWMVFACSTTALRAQGSLSSEDKLEFESDSSKETTDIFPAFVEFLKQVGSFGLDGWDDEDWRSEVRCWGWESS